MVGGEREVELEGCGANTGCCWRPTCEGEREGEEEKTEERGKGGVGRRGGEKGEMR